MSNSSAGPVADFGWKRVCPRCGRWFALQLVTVTDSHSWVYRCRYCRQEVTKRRGAGDQKA